MTQISVVDDPGAAVAERLTAVAERGGHVVLTGGSTPRNGYALLAERDVDWSRATVWFSDERCVPPDDENSNFGMADKALLSRLSRPPRGGAGRRAGRRGGQGAGGRGRLRRPARPGGARLAGAPGERLPVRSPRQGRRERLVSVAPPPNPHAPGHARTRRSGH